MWESACITALSAVCACLAGLLMALERRISRLEDRDEPGHGRRR